MNEIFKISLMRLLLRDLGNHFSTAMILKGWDLVQEWSWNWFIYLIMKLRYRNLDLNFNVLFARKKKWVEHFWFSALPRFYSASVIWFWFLATQLHVDRTRNCSDQAHHNFMLILTESIALPFKMCLLLGH